MARNLPVSRRMCFVRAEGRGIWSLLEIMDDSRRLVGIRGETERMFEKINFVRNSHRFSPANRLETHSKPLETNDRKSSIIRLYERTKVFVRESVAEAESALTGIPRSLILVTSNRLGETLDRFALCFRQTLFGDRREETTPTVFVEGGEKRATTRNSTANRSVGPRLARSHTRFPPDVLKSTLWISVAAFAMPRRLGPLTQEDRSRTSACRVIDRWGT